MKQKTTLELLQEKLADGRDELEFETDVAKKAYYDGYCLALSLACDLLHIDQKFNNSSY